MNKVSRVSSMWALRERFVSASAILRKAETIEFVFWDLASFSTIFG